MDVHILRNLVMRYGIKLGLSSSQKDCIWQLLDHDWNGKNIVWPGQKRVGERLGITTRQGIYKIIKVLENKKLIDVIESPGKGHRYEWMGLIKALLPFYEEEVRIAKEKADRLTGVNLSGKPQLTGEVNSSLPVGKLELTRSTINNTANEHIKEIQQPNILSNVNPQEAYTPQASTNNQEDTKIIDLPTAEKIVKIYFKITNGKLSKEIHKKLKPLVIQEEYTKGKLEMELASAGTVWRWLGKDEQKAASTRSYQKDYLQRDYQRKEYPKKEEPQDSGLEKWTRDFMINELIPLDTELNDGVQKIFYNRKTHPKIFQPAYEGKWPKEEILRRYEIYMNRGGYYAKAGHPLALFISQFDQFAKKKKRIDKSGLAFGGATGEGHVGLVGFHVETPSEKAMKEQGYTGEMDCWKAHREWVDRQKDKESAEKAVKDAAEKIIDGDEDDDVSEYQEEIEIDLSKPRKKVSIFD